MTLMLALIYVVIAGMINGSFALPIKHITGWRFENIWLNYAFWAFLILPLAILFVSNPHAFSVYQQASGHTLALIVIGGFFFGVGQVCFALALNIIGFSLGFVINIGLGTGLGFLMPLVVLHPQEISSKFGAVTLIGTVFIIVGLLYSFYAGVTRDKKRKQLDHAKTGNYHTGVLLAIVAGFFSACQNFSFAATSSLQKIALQHHLGHFVSANIMWPGFLICAFIPYAIYMLYLHQKNRSFKKYSSISILRYSPIAFTMAFFWYGSLMLYSKASLHIGNLGPIVAWPLFMVLIILTSNFWGWRHGEWAHASNKATKIMKRGIIALLIAVIVLAYSVSLSR